MSLRPLPANTAYTIYEILVPSKGKKYRFRPFLVKEHKMLMIAQSSADNMVMLNTLKSIISNCCVEDNPSLDVDSLATFDFEYLLIKLRSISVDTNVTLNVTCSDLHDGYPEETRTTQIQLNLDNIEIVGIDQYSTKVKLSDDLFVIMKLPTMAMIDSIPEPNDYEGNLKKVAAQIDKIFNNDEVFDVSEYTIDDLEQWLEQLTEDQLQNLLKYFNSIPYCQIKVEWTCPHCGKRNIRYIKGISYFF